MIKLIAELEEILANDRTLKNVIVKELRAVQKEYADERRTQIVESGVELTLEDLIADEDVVITLTHSGYVKRTPLTAYRSQRGGQAAGHEHAVGGRRLAHLHRLDPQLPDGLHQRGEGL